MAAHATIHMFVNKGFNKVLAVFNSIFDSDIGKIIKTQVKMLSNKHGSPLECSDQCYICPLFTLDKGGVSMEPRKVLKDAVTDEAYRQAFEKMKDDPEFAVDGCHYVIVREDRYQQYLDFLRHHFLKDEPLSANVSSLDFWDIELEPLCLLQIKPNLSLALLSDTTDEVIAARVITLHDRNVHFSSEDFESDAMKKIVDIYNHITTKCNIYDHYNVDELFHFFGFGVHRDYRRKGIATKVMKAAVALVKKLNIGSVVIQGEGTANGSKWIYEKLGFEILAEVVYEDYKVNGEIVFKNMGDEKFERLYGKIVC